MNKKLYQYSLENKIEIVTCKLPVRKLKGIYCDNVIYLDERIETEHEANCIIAEELGHHATSNGIILDQKHEKNMKQELRARKWAHDRLLKVEDLIEAHRAGCRSIYEVAEFLSVTEFFLLEAAQTFSREHSVYKTIDNYIVYFDPLGIMEIF